MYYHSVTLKEDKCMGCTNCIRRCPTEAIRVWGGKARIINERCIDCGECIRICPYHAKVATTDDITGIYEYKYRIALPAPALFGQFNHVLDIEKIINTLISLGFSSVFEVAKAADIVTAATKEVLKDPSIPRPVISSACPAILRLIQVRFPDLIPNILRLESPMEVAAIIAREEFCKDKNVDPDDVGVFFITPCAAKTTSVKNPMGKGVSAVSGTISIIDIYGSLSRLVTKTKYDTKIVPKYAASYLGVGWASSGGESKALEIEGHLAVDGIHNIIRVLEEIENNKLPQLEFFEGLSCIGGCIGGPLVFENNYIAKDNIRKLVNIMKNVEENPDRGELIEKYKSDPRIHFETELEQREVMKLDDNIVEALRKMEQIEELLKELPGLDCGSCGSPSCRTLAEDIVRGNAYEMDCIFKLRDKVDSLARQMVELASKDSARHQQ